MIETPWNYSILAEEMPTLLSVEDFHEMTANKYRSDSRVPSMIESVTATMRNYVHWHLGGNVECSVIYPFDDLHVTRSWNVLLVQLPSRHVTSVDKILLDGKEVDCIHFVKSSGLLKIYSAVCCSRFFTIEIRFKSGLDVDSGIKAIVASRVSNALSGVAGISSETAGGVTISYSKAYVAGINPTTLLTADREFLDSYQISELL